MAKSATPQATDPVSEALTRIVIGGDEVAMPPFEAALFSLGQLWPFDQDPTPQAGAPT